MNKKGEGMSITVIVTAAIAVLVLVVLVLVFTGRMGWFSSQSRLLCENHDGECKSVTAGENYAAKCSPKAYNPGYVCLDAEGKMVDNLKICCVPNPV